MRALDSNGTLQNRASSHSSDEVISFRDVKFVYELRPLLGFARAQAPPIVSDINFALRRGAALGIIGQSGSGKSTIAKLALGLLAPTEGEIVFEGRLLKTRLRDFRTRAQAVFQDPMESLDPRMCIGEQIEEPLVVAGKLSQSARRDKISAVLAEVGLGPEIIEKRPYQISGGQAQRVTIARALVLDPDILICDEPVSALDMTVQAQILNLLSRLRRDHSLSLMFISHDLRAVSYLCTDICVIHRGRIVEFGRREQVLFSPQAPHTKELLQALPGNPFASEFSDATSVTGVREGQHRQVSSP